MIEIYNEIARDLLNVKGLNEKKGNNCNTRLVNDF